MLARERPHLFLLSRTADELDIARVDLEARGAIVDALLCDIRHRQAVEEAVRQIVRRTGRVDVLINNAGIIQAMPFELSRVEDFDNSLDTLIAMVEAGEGMAVIPSFGVPACRNRKVQMMRLVNHVATLYFHLIQNRGRKPSPIVGEFTSFLQNYIARWAGRAGVL